ncbi:MAG: hypothetical protein FD161_890, partial [Limisphaerales bacterium]
ALARRAVDAERAGNVTGAAQLNLAVLQKREQIERLVTAEKERQAQLDRQAARDAQRMVDFAERARRERLSAGLRSGPASAAGGVGLGEVASGFGVPLSIGALIATVTSAFRSMLGMVGALKDNAEQLNVTVTEVQQSARVLRDQGQDVGSLGTALSQLGSTRRDAAEGNEELRASFAALGVSLADLNDPTKRNIDLLKQMGPAARDATDAQRELLKTLLGRGGDKLAGAIAGLNAVKADDVMAPDVVARVDEADKAFSRLWRGISEGSAKAYARTLQVAQPFFDIALGNYGGQTAPRQFKTQRERDRGGYQLDQIAIGAGRMTEDQASPEYQRYKSFTQAQAERPDLRLDYETWQRAKGPKPGPLFRDKTAEATAEKARAGEVAAGEQELANTQRRHELEMSMKSIAEQREDLARRRSLIELQIAETNDRAEKARLEAELIELDQRKAGLKDDPNAAASSYRVSASALQRIGGFTGGVGGFDPVQTRLDAIHAAASGNLQVAREMIGVLRSGLDVHFN